MMDAHKLLTDADLGLAARSNQTHIGLRQGMVRTYEKDDREISVWFYTPALGAEIPCKGILNAIERNHGAVDAPKLKSAGGSFSVGDALNVFVLIRHFATTGSKPRELWMKERDDGTFHVQLLPSTATEMFTLSAVDKPLAPSALTTPLTGTPNKIATSLYLAKPFIILAGPSGTGKSRWVRQQAFLTHKATNEERQSIAPPPNYQLLSVKPNWHDSSELLGYVTRLGLQPSQSSRYVVTEFVRFLVRAWRHLDTPHWLCLDEMNLAPVEQYLAEFLSVIETRRVQDGIVTTDALLTSQSLAALSNGDWDRFCTDAGLDASDLGLMTKIRKEGLCLPPNLIIVGTVNMDETAHSFSRKVLDRAFVWEMPIGDLASSWEALGYPETPAPWTPLPATTGREARKLIADEWVVELLTKLESVNVCLTGSPFQVSYRVRDELLLLAAARKVNSVDDLYRVLDDGLYAKVLPRIEGDAARVRRPLMNLGRLLAGFAELDEWSSALPESGEEDRRKLQALSVEQDFLFELGRPTAGSDPFVPVLPWRRSLRKIRSMLLRLDGHFSSYWD